MTPLGPASHAGDPIFLRSGSFRHKASAWVLLGGSRRMPLVRPGDPEGEPTAACHDRERMNTRHVSIADGEGADPPSGVGCDGGEAAVQTGHRWPDDAASEFEPESSIGCWDDAQLSLARRAADAERCRAEAQAFEHQLQPLVERMVQGGSNGEHAFAALYQLTVDRVYAAARRYSTDAALVEEVVEDVFVQAWRDAALFDRERGSVLGWLLVIARSRMLDRLRRERAIPLRFDSDLADVAEQLQAQDLGVPAPGDDPVDLLDALDRRHWVALALERLPAGSRQLVALAFLRGQTHQEIAAGTGIPIGTVKSVIRRALLEMRRFLQSVTPELARQYPIDDSALPEPARSDAKGDLK